MAEIKNREDLQRWLKGKPVEVSRVIALRAALRCQTPSKTDQQTAFNFDQLKGWIFCAA